MMMMDKTLSLPASLSNKLRANSTRFDHKKGAPLGSFLIGMTAALVVSPCVSAPLAAISAYMAALGSPLFGFGALFLLGLGLSMPLLLIGAGARFLPKAGAWTASVRVVAGALLLLVGVSLVGRVWAWANLWLLSAWCVILGACLVWRCRALLALLGGFLLMMGAVFAIGAYHGHISLAGPVRLINPAPHLDIQKITTISALDEILKTHDKVLVKVDADWCIECRIMKKTLFTEPPKALGAWRVVSFDITQTTDDSRALLARYGLMGPPALIYYQNGQWVGIKLGEVARANFENSL